MKNLWYDFVGDSIQLDGFYTVDDLTAIIAEFKKSLAQKEDNKKQQCTESVVADHKAEMAKLKEIAVTSLRYYENQVENAPAIHGGYKAKEAIAKIEKNYGPVTGDING